MPARIMQAARRVRKVAYGRHVLYTGTRRQHTIAAQNEKNSAARPHERGQNNASMNQSRVFLIAASLALCASAEAQRVEPEIGLLPVQGNLYMLHAGEAGNIAVQIGSDGVLLVNTLREDLADRIAAEIATLTPAPIRFIINTSDDLHNTAGNAELAALGMFGSTPALAPGEQPGATLVAHENVMLRLTALSSARRDPFPGAAIPRDVYFLPQKDIWFNDEPVFIMHEPNAHSDGDSIVLFRKSDTIAVGDIFTPGEYPVIDVERGGSVQGLIRALNHILDLAVPERRGRECD